MPMSAYRQQSKSFSYLVKRHSYDCYYYETEYIFSVFTLSALHIFWGIYVSATMNMYFIFFLDTETTQLIKIPPKRNNTGYPHDL